MFEGSLGKTHGVCFSKQQTKTEFFSSIEPPPNAVLENHRKKEIFGVKLYLFQGEIFIISF